MTSINNKSLWRNRKLRGGAKRTGVYRSKFESDTATWLKDKGYNFLYEKEKIKYIKPVTNHTYTPDFRVTNHKWYIEVKGLFTSEDRKKHIYIRDQGGPEIRFLFYNANAKIRKGSKTTYAMWCDKEGFKWAHKIIPEDWLTVVVEK